jgi:uncharacterized membrane protein YfcA
MTELLPFAGLLLLGAATGFAAGLLGIGGAMMMVPFLTLLLPSRGVPHAHVVHVAVATSLTTIAFTSLSSMRAHHGRGAVRWPIVKRLAPGILAGSLAGAQIAGALPTAAIALLFAVFVGFSATQMLRDRKPSPSRELPGTPGMLGMGTLIGGLSSLVGAGGGFVSVPFMVWCNVPMQQAVATSAALGFPIALAGALGFVIAGWNVTGLPAGTVGFIYVPALVTIAASSVLTAPLGARVAHAIDVRRLKQVFAAMLYALAAFMIHKGLSGPAAG